jgi:hypothetical protein
MDKARITIRFGKKDGLVSGEPTVGKEPVKGPLAIEESASASMTEKGARYGRVFRSRFAVPGLARIKGVLGAAALAALTGTLMGLGLLFLFTSHRGTASLGLESSASDLPDLSAIPIYLVQVGAFRDRESAEEGLALLASKDVQATIVGESPCLLVAGAVTGRDAGQAVLHRLDQQSVHYYLKPILLSLPFPVAADRPEKKEANAAMAREIAAAAALAASDSQGSGGTGSSAAAVFQADRTMTTLLEAWKSRSQGSRNWKTLEDWNLLLKQAASAGTTGEAELSLAKFFAMVPAVQAAFSELAAE